MQTANQFELSNSTAAVLLHNAILRFTHGGLEEWMFHRIVVMVRKLSG